VRDHEGKRLAYEGQHTGYWLYWHGQFRRLTIPADTRPQLGQAAITWDWSQPVERMVVRTQTHFVVTDDRYAVRFLIIFSLDHPTARPHFSWGIDIDLGGTLNNYHWIPGPTHTAYSFESPPLTLWLVSTYDRQIGVTPFDGCQALITIPRGRIMHSNRFRDAPPPERALEMRVGMPPGYEDVAERYNLLPAGEPARLHGFLVLDDGYYDASVQRVHALHPLEPLPQRFSYWQHLRDVTDMLLDPAKYFEEHEGIMLYAHGEGPAHEPKVSIGREGPGWGGAWDTEVAAYLMRYREHVERDLARKNLLRDHARRMIDGWLTNPRFVFSRDLTWRAPGDMRGSMSSSMEWKRRGTPPYVWTAHHAYMIIFLLDLYALGRWDDCLETALDLGEWFLRNQQPDGSIPGMWMVDINRAIPWGGSQPASTAFMIPALRKLHAAAPDDRWLAAARRLADHYVDELLAERPEYGNGEPELIVWESDAVIATSLAYIVWGYADAYDLWSDARHRQVLERYTRMLLALGATWEPNEELLRGPEKVKVPPYGMDRKIAGGFSIGTFRHFFYWQMNRNEIGYALMRAYEVLGDQACLNWLRAFIDWHTYYVFTEEVALSPVTTYGSSPQNHRWTSSKPMGWDNDWGCTAAKMAYLMLDALRRGYLADGETLR
jgi:hypothetical protein